MQSRPNSRLRAASLRRRYARPFSKRRLFTCYPAGAGDQRLGGRTPCDSHNQSYVWTWLCMTKQSSQKNLTTTAVMTELTAATPAIHPACHTARFSSTARRFPWSLSCVTSPSKIRFLSSSILVSILVKRPSTRRSCSSRSDTTSPLLTNAVGAQASRCRERRS